VATGATLIGTTFCSFGFGACRPYLPYYLYFLGRSAENGAKFDFSVSMMASTLISALIILACQVPTL
jgi:hypothetical protein